MKRPKGQPKTKAAARRGKLKRGQMVILESLPEGFLDGLPEEDQRAITAVIGKRIRFNGYDELGHVELEFEEPSEDPKIRTLHAIWVAPKFIRVVSDQ